VVVKIENHLIERLADSKSCRNNVMQRKRVYCTVVVFLGRLLGRYCWMQTLYVVNVKRVT
jgi:hypothetical protein